MWPLLLTPGKFAILGLILLFRVKNKQIIIKPVYYFWGRKTYNEALCITKASLMMPVAVQRLANVNTFLKIRFGHSSVIVGYLRSKQYRH